MADYTGVEFHYILDINVPASLHFFAHLEIIIAPKNVVLVYHPFPIFLSLYLTKLPLIAITVPYTPLILHSSKQTLSCNGR